MALNHTHHLHLDAHSAFPGRRYNNPSDSPTSAQKPKTPPDTSGILTLCPATRLSGPHGGRQRYNRGATRPQDRVWFISGKSSMNSTSAVAVCPYRANIDHSDVQYTDFSHVQYFQSTDSEREEFAERDEYPPQHGSHRVAASPAGSAEFSSDFPDENRGETKSNEITAKKKKKNRKKKNKVGKDAAAAPAGGKPNDESNTPTNVNASGKKKKDRKGNKAKNNTAGSLKEPPVARGTPEPTSEALVEDAKSRDVKTELSQEGSGTTEQSLPLADGSLSVSETTTADISEETEEARSPGTPEPALKNHLHVKDDIASAREGTDQRDETTIDAPNETHTQEADPAEVSKAETGEEIAQGGQTAPEAEPIKEEAQEATFISEPGPKDSSDNDKASEDTLAEVQTKMTEATCESPKDKPECHTSEHKSGVSHAQDQTNDSTEEAFVETAATDVKSSESQQTNEVPGDGSIIETVIEHSTSEEGTKKEQPELDLPSRAGQMAQEARQALADEDTSASVTTRERPHAADASRTAQEKPRNVTTEEMRDAESQQELLSPAVVADSKRASQAPGPETSGSMSQNSQVQGRTSVLVPDPGPEASEPKLAEAAKAQDVNAQQLHEDPAADYTTEVAEVERVSPQSPIEDQLDEPPQNDAMSATVADLGTTSVVALGDAKEIGIEKEQKTITRVEAMSGEDIAQEERQEPDQQADIALLDTQDVPEEILEPTITAVPTEASPSKGAECAATAESEEHTTVDDKKKDELCTEIADAGALPAEIGSQDSETTSDAAAAGASESNLKNFSRKNEDSMSPERAVSEETLKETETSTAMSMQVEAVDPKLGAADTIDDVSLKRAAGYELSEKDTDGDIQRNNSAHSVSGPDPENSEVQIEAEGRIEIEQANSGPPAEEPAHSVVATNATELDQLHISTGELNVGTNEQQPAEVELVAEPATDLAESASQTETSLEERQSEALTSGKVQAEDERKLTATGILATTPVLAEAAAHEPGDAVPQIDQLQVAVSPKLSDVNAEDNGSRTREHESEDVTAALEVDTPNDAERGAPEALEPQMVESVSTKIHKETDDVESLTKEPEVLVACAGEDFAVGVNEEADTAEVTGNQELAMSVDTAAVEYTSEKAATPESGATERAPGTPGAGKMESLESPTAAVSDVTKPFTNTTSPQGELFAENIETVTSPAMDDQEESAANILSQDEDSKQGTAPTEAVLENLEKSLVTDEMANPLSEANPDLETDLSTSQLRDDLKNTASPHSNTSPSAEFASRRASVEEKVDLFDEVGEQMPSNFARTADLHHDSSAAALTETKDDVQQLEAADSDTNFENADIPIARLSAEFVADNVQTVEAAEITEVLQATEAEETEETEEAAETSETAEAPEAPKDPTTIEAIQTTGAPKTAELPETTETLEAGDSGTTLEHAEIPVAKLSAESAADNLRNAEGAEVAEAHGFPEAHEFPEPPEFPEAHELPEPPEFPEAHEFPEPPEFPEAHELPEPPEFPEAHELPEPPEFPEAHKLPEPPEFPEAHELPEPPEFPEAHELPEAHEFPEPPEFPEAYEIPEAHEFPEAVETAETVEAAKTSETAETTETVEAAETAEASATMEAVQATEAHETAETVEAAKASETTEALQAIGSPKTAEAPINIEASQAPEAPETAETSETAEATEVETAMHERTGDPATGVQKDGLVVKSQAGAVESVPEAKAEDEAVAAVVNEDIAALQEEVTPVNSAQVAQTDEQQSAPSEDASVAIAATEQQLQEPENASETIPAAILEEPTATSSTQLVVEELPVPATTEFISEPIESAIISEAASGGERTELLAQTSSDPAQGEIVEVDDANLDTKVIQEVQKADSTSANSAKADAQSVEATLEAAQDAENVEAVIQSQLEAKPLQASDEDASTQLENELKARPSEKVESNASATTEVNEPIREVTEAAAQGLAPDLTPKQEAGAKPIYVKDANDVSENAPSAVLGTGPDAMTSEIAESNSEPAFELSEAPHYKPGPVAGPDAEVEARGNSCSKTALDQVGEIPTGKEDVTAATTDGPAQDIEAKGPLRLDTDPQGDARADITTETNNEGSGKTVAAAMADVIEASNSTKPEFKAGSENQAEGTNLQEDAEKPVAVEEIEGAGRSTHAVDVGPAPVEKPEVDGRAQSPDHGTEELKVDKTRLEAVPAAPEVGWSEAVADAPVMAEKQDFADAEQPAEADVKNTGATRPGVTEANASKSSAVAAAVAGGVAVAGGAALAGAQMSKARRHAPIETKSKRSEKDERKASERSRLGKENVSFKSVKGEELSSLSHSPFDFRGLLRSTKAREDKASNRDISEFQRKGKLSPAFEHFSKHSRGTQLEFRARSQAHSLPDKESVKSASTSAKADAAILGAINPKAEPSAIIGPALENETQSSNSERRRIAQFTLVAVGMAALLDAKGTATPGSQRLGEDHSSAACPSPSSLDMSSVCIESPLPSPDVEIDSLTPPLVVPDAALVEMSRARWLKRRYYLLIRDIEETLAAVVVICAATVKVLRQAAIFGPGVLQDFAKRTPPAVPWAGSEEHSSQLNTDTSADEVSRTPRSSSGDRDRERRRRHRQSQHVGQSRHNRDEEEPRERRHTHLHHRTAQGGQESHSRRHRSDSFEATAPTTPPRSTQQRNSGGSGESSGNSGRRRHRTREEQAEHERRKAEKQLRGQERELRERHGKREDEEQHRGHHSRHVHGGRPEHHVHREHPEHHERHGRREYHGHHEYHERFERSARVERSEHADRSSHHRDRGSKMADRPAERTHHRSSRRHSHSSQHRPDPLPTEADSSERAPTTPQQTNKKSFDVRSAEGVFDIDSSPAAGEAAGNSPNDKARATDHRRRNSTGHTRHSVRREASDRARAAKATEPQRSFEDPRVSASKGNEEAPEDSARRARRRTREEKKPSGIKGVFKKLFG